MLTLTRAERAQTYPFLLRTLRCGHGDDSYTRSRRAWCEAIALRSGDLPQIWALADRLETLADRDHLRTYFVGTDTLNDAAGSSSEVARLAAEITCFERSEDGARWLAEGDDDGPAIEITAADLAGTPTP